MMFLRKEKLLRIAAVLVFGLHAGFFHSALAWEKTSSVDMLRPASASRNIGAAVLEMGIETLRGVSVLGSNELKARLADLAIDKTKDPSEHELIRNNIGVLGRDGKTFVVCLIGNGWKVDLSKNQVAIENFASSVEKDAFISGGQLTWLAGDLTPSEVIDAQAGAKAYLQQAGQDMRIFSGNNLAEQVAKYSSQRTSVARQLPPVAEKDQTALVKRLEAALAFHRAAIDVISKADVNAVYGLFEVEQVKNKIKEGVRQAIILDEDDSPSFFFNGKPRSDKFLAVTASAGGFKYAGYSYDKTKDAPKSIYTILAMVESYMELAKTDASALDAYKAKLMHEFVEVTSDTKYHKIESKEVTDLINKYDKLALNMWKAREAKKAEAKLERENKKVVAEVTSANIAKFLNKNLDEVIPDELIESAKDDLQKLVEVGLLTDYKVWANAGDLHVLTTRQNKDAVEDDAQITPALQEVFLNALTKAMEMGVYTGEKLAGKSYQELERVLEVRTQFQPMKFSERAAEPFGVFNVASSYAGAANLLLWEIFSNPMYNAGLTIDPAATRGYIFEVWDSVEDTTTRFDAQTENNKLRAWINQPGRFVVVGVYTKAEHKVATDEPLVMVSVKRMADDGKPGVGDFSIVVMMRAQSGLPAWGELIAPAGTEMPLLTYGGDKTKAMIAFRPTSIDEANKIPASQRKGVSIFTGFGFQSHNNGRIGKNEDIGGHQSMDRTRANADAWAKLFYDLPEYMDHVTKLSPFMRPHEYDRDDLVVSTRQALDSRFLANPNPKKSEIDELLEFYGDYAVSNIKADIGSVPGHYKPHPVTMRALSEILEIGKIYGFKGVDQYVALGKAFMLLNTGLNTDEIVGKKGIYRTKGSADLMKKVAEFKKKTVINNWDEAIAFINSKEMKDKVSKESMLALVSGLKEANVDYQGFMAALEKSSQDEAVEYSKLEEHRKFTKEEVDVLAMMIGVTAKTAKTLIDNDQIIRTALGLDEAVAEKDKIHDFTVWSSGDDCQLSMKHKRLSEDKLVHTLAWNALWYAADQTSYFQPYGWKQDILVDSLVSGNIQGAGPGYAEVQVKEGESILAFSADKCAPGAFTVPILGMIRKAIAEGKFQNGVIAEIWDINHSKRAFFDLTNAEDFQNALNLLRSPEEFAIKRVWTAKKKWDGKNESIKDTVDSLPLISASTERLVLTAGEYVGKDDPTILVRISQDPNEQFNKQDVKDVFQYPQTTLGFMRGSHVGPLVPGVVSRFDKRKSLGGLADFKILPEATPHNFDGPPPLAGLELTFAATFDEAQDIFANVPWLAAAIKQGGFLTQVLRRQGWNAPHKIEGAETEYTTFPEVFAAVKAEGRSKEANPVAKATFLESLLGLQSKGISHKLSADVIKAAKTSANDKVVLISSRILASDPSLILALQSINGQINKNLGVFASDKNIDANAYKFVLVVDDPAIKTAADLNNLFAGIAKATNNAVKVNKGIFSKVITQEDMYEGKITNVGDLAKQLDRFGISSVAVEAVVGPAEWTSGLKAENKLFGTAIAVNVDAKKSEVALGASALFGVVEAIARQDKQIPAAMVAKLDLAIKDMNSIVVDPKETDSRIQDFITAYRETVESI